MSSELLFRSMSNATAISTALVSSQHGYVSGGLGSLARGRHNSGGSRDRFVFNPPYFFARSHKFFVLFRSAYVSDVGGFLISLALTFAFSALATIAMFAISHMERMVLERRPRASAPTRLLVAFAHAAKMALLYLIVLLLLVRNLWMCASILLGHVVGWVIISGIRLDREKKDKEEGVESKENEGDDPRCSAV